MSDISGNNLDVLLQRLFALDDTAFEVVDDFLEAGGAFDVLTPRVKTVADTATMDRTWVGAVILSSKASAVTFTTPAAADLTTFPVGASCKIIQTGAGKVQIAGGSGVTVSNDGAGLFFAAQHDVGILTRTAAATYHLSGHPLAAS